MSSSQETMGQRVAKTRARRNLTQRDLAKKAELSVPFVSEIENDKRNVSSDVLLRLADALGVSMDYLMKGEEQREASKDRSPSFPPSLDRAAQEREWAYADAALLLEARELIIARRKGEEAEKPLDEYTERDWAELYRKFIEE